MNNVLLAGKPVTQFPGESAELRLRKNPPDDDARIDAAALAPALSEALATLPSGQREVLLLHAWAGLSPAEIATALGLSPASVRKRLHRARAHVGGRVGRFGNEPGDDVPEARKLEMEATP